MDVFSPLKCATAEAKYMRKKTGKSNFVHIFSSGNSTTNVKVLDKYSFMFCIEAFSLFLLTIRKLSVAFPSTGVHYKLLIF